MKVLKSRKGVTLVELLVTFALFAVFMVSAVAVLSPCSRIFLKIKYMSYAQNVSAMVMSKIEDEIAMATGQVLVDNTGEDPGAGARISFEDSYGTPLYIEKDTDNLMKIHYRGATNAAGVIEGAVDWKYDVKAYQGFEITNLSFSVSSGGRGVSITLELHNSAREISYSTTKVIECYNLPDTDSVKQGPVIISDADYEAT